MLSSALSVIPGLRGVGSRLSDEEYLALGRRANQQTLSDAYAEDLFVVMRDGEHLDHILEVPFALAHIKDVNAAMQVAIAGVGESREDLTSHSLFHPGFAAFVLGFAMGFATAHRLKYTDGRSVRLHPRSQAMCDDWGIAVALFYLVKVEALGIIDLETDRDVYGIDNRWRLVGDDRRMEPFEHLHELVQQSRAIGEGWFSDESADMGVKLIPLLERLVDLYPGRAFH